MATSPTAPADPSASPADDVTVDNSASPAPADSADESDTVLVTISKTADGTYMVYAGDEPDDDTSEGDEGGQGGDEGGEATPTPEGKPCDSMGAALKAAMDILKDDEESESGEGSADDNFSAGFKGGSSASPAKPEMAQKY